MQYLSYTVTFNQRTLFNLQMITNDVNTGIGQFWHFFFPFIKKIVCSLHKNVNWFYQFCQTKIEATSFPLDLFLVFNPSNPRYLLYRLHVLYISRKSVSIASGQQFLFRHNFWFFIIILSIFILNGVHVKKTFFCCYYFVLLFNGDLSNDVYVCISCGLLSKTKLKMWCTKKSVM